MQENGITLTEGQGILAREGNKIFLDDPRIAELEKRVAALEARIPQAADKDGEDPYEYKFREEASMQGGLKINPDTTSLVVEKSLPDRVVRRPRCRPTGA